MTAITKPKALSGKAILVIVSGCLIAMMTFGPRSAFGLFFIPITESLGLSREMFAIALAIQNLMWGVGQPVAGAIADKYGSARVIAFGGVIYALGLVVTAWAPNLLWLNIGAGILIGIGVACASFAIVLSAFGKIVSPEKQSIAFGLGTAAGSLGQFIFAPLGQMLIETQGWQNALVFLGAMMLIIPVLALMLRTKPSDAPAVQRQEMTMTQTLVAAFGYRSYVLLVAGFFVCGFQVAFITVHLPTYIVDLGFDASLAAWSIALIGIFNVFGALAAGVIGGRYSKPMFLSYLYVARSIVVVIFISTPATPSSVLIFSAAMGVLWLSTVPPTSGLVAIMFGPRYMATLFGFVFFSHQIGSFLGVWLGGRFYDLYGSYDGFWWLSIALGVFAALVHWPIKETPYKAAGSEAV